MGVEINDFRELRKKQFEKEGRPVPPMLAQAEAESVGDDSLDKMLRALAAKKAESTNNIVMCAQKTASTLDDTGMRTAQAHYFFEQGRSKAFEEAMQIPAQIMAESKPLVHS